MRETAQRELMQQAVCDMRPPNLRDSMAVALLQSSAVPGMPSCAQILWQTEDDETALSRQVFLRRRRQQYGYSQG